MCQRVLGLWNFRNVESLADQDRPDTDLVGGGPSMMFDFGSLYTKGVAADSLGKSAHPLEQIMALDTLLKMSQPGGKSTQEGEMGRGDKDRETGRGAGMETEGGKGGEPIQTQCHVDKEGQQQQGISKPDISPDFLEAIIAVDTVLKMSHIDSEEQGRSPQGEEADQGVEERPSPEEADAMATNGVSHSESDTTMTVSTGSPNSKQAADEEQETSSPSLTASGTISEASPEKATPTESPGKDITDSSADGTHKEEPGEPHSGSKLLEIVGRLQQAQDKGDQGEVGVDREQNREGEETMDTREESADQSEVRA